MGTKSVGGMKSFLVVFKLFRKRFRASGDGFHHVHVTTWDNTTH